MDIRIRCFVLFALFLGGGNLHAEVQFNRDIRPILSDRCFACHGPDAHERKAKLRLDIPDGPDGAYRTHEGVTSIKPGSIEESEIWFRLTTDDKEEVMPPPKSHKKVLSKPELELFRQWIEGGAPYEAFWAFVPPKSPVLPSVKQESWSRDPIDLFVLRRLEAEGKAPSPEAEKRTLIRRLTFDLTGLPPTREEIQEFLADSSADAYQKLVDRLLARPQYGEHMARYWLDLVRFADTNGMHKDFYRNFITYRDWVIRSFNDNLRYDDFVRYQIAGDLYEAPTNDQLVASGFNRLHLIIDVGTALPEESYVKNVVDRITAVGTAFMGLTVQCAMCHDHKFDPISQKDFYSLFAFFNNIDAKPETAWRPANGLQPPFITLGSPQQQAKLETFDQQLAQLEKELKAAKEAELKEQDTEKKKPLAAARKAIEGKRNEAKGARDKFNRSIPGAMVMKERKDIRPAFMLTRGQYDAPGEEVSRNTPGFLPSLKKKSDIASRMDFAEWLVAKENPLTARVAVNRFWQQFFGVGLVKTAEDFGAQGQVPSHPELFDHLTVSFVESGWDIKALARAMVLSKTYRQSSLATPEQFQEDAENRLLARGARYRMDAEMIRDQILATSGLLSATMYGRSVKPPQPDGLWAAVTMTGERFKPDSGDDIYRRSMYTYWKRGMPPPQMTILNAPIRDACIARRERTNTPSQALLLLNETEYLKAARTLAQRTLAQAGLSDAQRIDYAWEVVTARLPDEKERTILAGQLATAQQHYAANPELTEESCHGLEMASPEAKTQLASWTLVMNTLYNLDITKTRE